MISKEQMERALTNLLKKGEQLMYPIYGLLVQGKNQYYGYFGLTDRFLLIALVSGTTITHTTRVPLEIRSVTVKKNFFLNEHVIDIQFCEGAPCRISAFPKVLAIDSQKENLPLFLSCLKSKCSEKESLDLRQVPGTKVRRQCFHFILYAYVATLLPIVPMIYLLECKGQGVSPLASGQMLVDIIGESLPVIVTLLLPLFLLSLGCKYLFGSVLAVISEEGLYLNGAYLSWQDIKTVIYTPTHFSRVNFRAAHITITVSPPRKREYVMDVSHFTLYGLRKLKRYLPAQSVRWAKGELILAIFFAVLPTVLFLLMALFF